MRILIIALAVLAVSAADTFVDPHEALIRDQVAAGECNGVCLVYENSGNLHFCHYTELYLLMGLGCVFLLGCLSPVAKIGVPAMAWALLGVLLLLLGAGNAVQEMITDGAQGQFGAKLSFGQSLLPVFVLDFAVAVGAVVLLCLGPPRGWGGDESLDSFDVF